MPGKIFEDSVYADEINRQPDDRSGSASGAVATVAIAVAIVATAFAGAIIKILGVI